MAYRIRYRPTALAQLDAIFAYIATHDRSAAQRVIAYIERTIGRLANFPYSSRQSEIPEIRELPIVRYSKYCAAIDREHFGGKFS